MDKSEFEQLVRANTSSDVRIESIEERWNGRFSVVLVKDLDERGFAQFRIGTSFSADMGGDRLTEAVKLVGIELEVGEREVRFPPRRTTSDVIGRIEALEALHRQDADEPDMRDLPVLLTREEHRTLFRQIASSGGPALFQHEWTGPTAPYAGECWDLVGRRRHVKDADVAGQWAGRLVLIDVHT